jgi:RNA polymerase sigma-70 factor, ECF subfamily
MTLDRDTDEELLAEWQTGDSNAGAELFDRHHKAIVRFFRNKVDDSHRDDLIQQTFMAAQTAKFHGNSAVRTWLIAIAWRRLADYLRREARRSKREIEAFGTESVLAMGQSPETHFVRQQERRLLLEGLRRIPLHQQVVLELHYWEEMTGSEIATALEIPVGTVKTRLRDGRLRLNQVLREISNSAEVLKSTLDNLEAWARRSKVIVDSR